MRTCLLDDPALDMAAPGDGDSGGADGGASNDLAPVIPLEPTPGCASGMGYRKTGTMVACPGAFGAGAFYNRCGVGWSLCQANPVGAGLCEFGLPGFFAGGAPTAQAANFPPNASLQCSWTGASTSWPRGIAGCGVSVGGQTHPANMKQCGSYPRVQLCGAGGWSCPAGNPPNDTDFSKVTNVNPNDGVWCCQ